MTSSMTDINAAVVVVVMGMPDHHYVVVMMVMHHNMVVMVMMSHPNPNRDLGHLLTGRCFIASTCVIGFQSR
jgi:hypothetical protein